MTRNDDDRRKHLPAKKTPKPPVKKGPLSEEDRELWQTLAQSVAPLRRMKPRIAASERSGLDKYVPRSEPQFQPDRPSALLPHFDQPPLPGLPQRQGPPPLAPFDRKRSRRIAAGRIEIEARLDLHGARLTEAYGRFRWFLLDCAARGLSTVLVVTGKGGPRSEKEPVPRRYGGSTSGDYGADAPERGVLRRSVPLWLEEPELRLLVASYTTADIKHGGAGALYLHLRKRRFSFSPS